MLFFCENHFVLQGELKATQSNLFNSGKMKKASLTAIIAFTLLIYSLVVPDVVQTAKANWGPIAEPTPIVTIDAPNDHQTCGTTFMLNFTVTHVASWYGYVNVDWFAFVLDGYWIGLLTPVIVRSEIIKDYFHTVFGSDAANVTQFSTMIVGLGSGPHTIEIQIKTNSIMFMDFDVGTTYAESSANFTVDADFPSVSILSPRNEAFSTIDVPLIFNVDKPASWFAYSIDNQDKVTIIGNTTLRMLSEGTHNITVYAKNSLGNIGESEIISFAIDLPPTPTPSPSPTPASTPTLTPSPTISPSPSPSPSPSLSESPSPSPTPAPTEEPATTPSHSPANQQQGVSGTFLSPEYVLAIAVVFVIALVATVAFVVRNRKSRGFK